MYQPTIETSSSSSPLLQSNDQNPTTTSSFGRTDNFSSGYTMYEINNLIQDYVYPTDEGVIDASNMYKAMYEVASKFVSVSQSCTSMTDKSVSAVFNFGSDLLTQTYDCGLTQTEGNYRTSGVVKTSGTESFALIGWSYTESVTGGTKTTRNAMQGHYDTSTNDVSVNMAYLVDYPTDPDYSVRIYIRGNTITGLFSLKLVKYNTGGSVVSISGYGYSRGSNYYLFKVTSTGSSSDVTDAYYCFESSTTTAEIEAMADAGSGTVPANCTGYDTNLPTMYATDGSDSATVAGSFTGTGDYNTDLTY